MPPAEAPAIEIVQDVRLDQIGYCDELAKLHADPLRPKVKAHLVDKGVVRAGGKYFDGQLVQYEASSIDPAKFYRLWRRTARFGEAQFLAAISVNKKAAAELLTGIEIDAISTKAGFLTQALRVTRRKGVDLRLIDMVRELCVTQD